MSKIKHVFFIIIILLTGLINSQEIFKFSKEEIKANFITFNHYKKQNGKISYHIFDSYPFIQDCCNKNVIDSIFGLFYIKDIDSIWGYTTNLQKEKVLIIDVFSLKIDSIKSTLPSMLVDTCMLPFNIITLESQLKSKRIIINDTCYLGLSTFYDRLPPKMYHGYKVPLCIDSVYIPNFPLGMLGNIHTLIKD